jgi:BatD DUF11 like domain
MKKLSISSNSCRKTPSHRIALVCALLLLPVLAFAQKVTADLSQEVTAVGQPVQLNISVVGGRGAQVPNQLNVPGLDVRFAGRSEQVNVVNFQMTVSAIYSYLVIPTQTGDFVIPAIPVTVGGRTYKTSPLTLRVGGNSGGVPVMPALPVQPSQPSPGQQYPTAQMPQGRPTPARQNGDPAFGDLIIPKKTAYVGEIIPVEVRFYFSEAYPVRLADRPSFSGDGFTVLNFSKPVQREQEVNGQMYNVVIFQTAITPVKPGSLEVTPANIEAQISMPDSGQQGGQDDFFNNFFNGSGFGMQAKQVTVSTKPQQVEVKPLPSEGRPDDFSGAIGQFSLQASASPKKAEAGDPITLSAVISGRGNFESLSAPTLADSENWKSYPPSEKFDPSPKDPIGYNGQKTFDYMIVARQDATLTPSPEFSFFDPAVEKYVTLKAGPIAVAAKGSAGVTPPATVAAASAQPTPAPTAAPAATPPPASTDLLATDFHPASFEPFIFSNKFLISNGVIAAAWLAFLLFGLGRAAANSSMAQKSARRRETRRLLQRTDDLSATPEQFYQGAETFIRARLAPEESSLDTRELLTRSTLPVDTKEKIGAILDRADERRYSTSSLAHLGADERQAIIQQLKSFDEQLD